MISLGNVNLNLSKVSDWEVTWWLMPVILTTRVAEIRKMMV
jgi:hypothetical protein